MQPGERAAWVGVENSWGRLGIDPAIGNLRVLAFRRGGASGDREITPLHTAPWVREAAASAEGELALVERYLAGDFFCAPFGLSDVEPAPPHGWPANSQWDLTGRSADSLSLNLRKTVMGAKISKALHLAPDAPLLYQVHIVSGGAGALSFAHHPMIRIAGRGRFSCSPKRAMRTPDAPLEPNRNRLALSKRGVELTAFPGSDGTAIDLTDLPIGDAHEDFITLIEAPNRSLGWSAILREEEDDIVFILKDPRILPVTMLWHSNGGRDYAPWLGRHRGVLGVEDGCAAGVGGHAAALAPNPIAGEGVATAHRLAPDRSHRIAQVIGAIPRPADWTRVVEIALSGPNLRLVGDRGTPVTLPFDPEFFARTD